MSSNKEVRVAKWYFGGFAGSGAACITHPLDLLKVHLQTQAEGKAPGLINMTIHIAKHQGVRALYNGISASILRQMTYTLTRFGIYESLKQNLYPSDANVPFHAKVMLAGISGAIGGYVGTPGDMLNVRMQNDIKLAPELRRNYKHAIDGLWQVARKEGVRALFSGATTATGRAILMNIGQLSFYDQAKQMLLSTGYCKDNFLTHFLSSFIAGGIATAMTQPMDVLKTRMMNAKPGEYKGVIDCTLQTAKQGPTAFFKGLVPAFIRLAPHTILLFLFFEQLRLNFGDIVVVKLKDKE